MFSSGVCGMARWFFWSQIALLVPPWSAAGCLWVGSLINAGLSHVSGASAGTTRLIHLCLT